MRQIIGITAGAIAVIATILFFLKPDSEKNLALESSASVTAQSIPTPSADNRTTAAAVQLPQKKQISATALAYHQQASEHGYASLVPAFERGAIANSDMSAAEQEKLCEITLTHVRVAELKRLDKVNCRARNGRASFMSISKALTTENGDIDQAAIIEKLEYFRARNELQTEVTYQIAGFEFGIQDSVYHRVVAFDLDQVFNYLQAIGAPLPKDNLIHDHLRGFHPNLATIKKLQNLGYPLDQKSFEIMQTAHFQSKHADLARQLQP